MIEQPPGHFCVIERVHRDVLPPPQRQSRLSLPNAAVPSRTHADNRLVLSVESPVRVKSLPKRHVRTTSVPADSDRIADGLPLRNCQSACGHPSWAPMGAGTMLPTRAGADGNARGIEFAWPRGVRGGAYFLWESGCCRRR